MDYKPYVVSTENVEIDAVEKFNDRIFKSDKGLVGEPKRIVHDLFGGGTRLFEGLHIGQKIRMAEDRKPALTLSEKVSGTSQFKIFSADLKAVGSLTKSVEPFQRLLVFCIRNNKTV